MHFTHSLTRARTTHSPTTPTSTPRHTRAHSRSLTRSLTPSPLTHPPTQPTHSTPRSLTQPAHPLAHSPNPPTPSLTHSPGRSALADMRSNAPHIIDRRMNSRSRGRFCLGHPPCSNGRKMRTMSNARRYILSQRREEQKRSSLEGVGLVEWGVGEVGEVE